MRGLGQVNQDARRVVTATIGEVMREVAALLSAEGIDDGRADARRLVQAATGMSREQTMLEPGRVLDQREAMRLEEMVRRRLAREPVTRILGERHFYGRPFEVTPATLDPRPDTETLVELALEIAAEEGWGKRSIDILDIGTGSGCILLTLLAELPLARGIGIDISAAAIEVAQRNAVRLGVSERAAWQVCGFPACDLPRFDLVVSNPPYIPAGDIEGLDPEVRQYDPMPALDGGADGLDVIRDIVDVSSRRRAWRDPGHELGLGTWLVLEVGAGQAPGVAALVAEKCGQATAATIRLRKDLGGHTRCVAWKPHF